ncbi:sigma-70 family RNA polymerase sigma factor, partial [[Clostridium] innocuum]|nr:sigma-70 family RNA polymerase sigma factor [[Clostridium] innocuum]
MAYNHGKAERKWKLWKEKEEKILRDSGVSEDIIETIRLYDRQAFNSDRRYYERVQETGTYLDTVAASTDQAEPKTVQDFLDHIENQELYH